MRRVTFVVNSRANYARIKTAIRESIKLDGLDVKLIVGASGLLYRFGEVSKIIEKDGFSIDNKIFSVVEGNEPISMVKTTALSTLSLADEFRRTQPDIVVTVADRYETIATALAASYMNIPVAHTQGGEITGSIDDRVRNAVSMLSHVHFPATSNAAKTLERFFIDPNQIFNVGCPSIDLIYESQDQDPIEVFSRYHGTGATLNFNKPYILVSQHPDTLNYKNSGYQISQTLEACSNLNIQVVWLWPNVDSGSDELAKKLREFSNDNNNNIHFYRNFSAEDYITILKNSRCIVGNSSSGIREAGFLGKPSVNIGFRQNGRERCSNVIDVDYDSAKIREAISYQLSVSQYEPDQRYGDGLAGVKIAHILQNCDLTIEKYTFNEL